MTYKEYLSDEELSALINDVEENSMIKAPAHLKSDILCEISQRRSREKKLRLMTYRAKVITGVAAAILIFCTVPFMMPSSVERAEIASKQSSSNYEAMIERKTEEEKREEKQDLIVEKIKDKIDIFGRIKK